MVARTVATTGAGGKCDDDFPVSPRRCGREGRSRGVVGEPSRHNSAHGATSHPTEMADTPNVTPPMAGDNATLTATEMAHSRLSNRVCPLWHCQSPAVGGVTLAVSRWRRHVVRGVCNLGLIARCAASREHCSAAMARPPRHATATRDHDALVTRDNRHRTSLLLPSLPPSCASPVLCARRAEGFPHCQRSPDEVDPRRRASGEQTKSSRSRSK